MSRRRAAKKRELLPDAKYGHVVVAQLINRVMLDGKKSVAEKIVYVAINTLAEKLKVDPVEAFEKAVANVRPLAEVRSRRVGGATYQIPVEVYPERAQALALRWIILGAKARKVEKDMANRVAGELLDAYNGRGEAVKKRENSHRMAEANKPFSHYKW